MSQRDEILALASEARPVIDTVPIEPLLLFVVRGRESRRSETVAAILRDPVRTKEYADFIDEAVRLIREQIEIYARLNRLFMAAWKGDYLDALWTELRHKFPEKTYLHYFIRCRGLGDIKIGKTNDIRKRFRQIVGMCPRGAALVGCYPADTNHETELKVDFRQYRLNGEWFSPSPAILDYLKRLGSDVANFSLETHLHTHLTMRRMRRREKVIQ